MVEFNTQFFSFTNPVRESKILVPLLQKWGPTKVIRAGMVAAFDGVYIQQARTGEKSIAFLGIFYQPV
jgi:hypothetical protein